MSQTHPLTRVLLLLAATAIMFASTLGAGEGALIDTTKSRYTRMYLVDLDDVRWEKGFWGERFAVCRQSMLPNMWRILNDPLLCHAYANFEVAAGVGRGRDQKHHGPPWHDGDFYKWLEATAMVYAVAGDRQLDEMMDRIIAVVAKAQAEDGYLHTPTVIELGRGAAQPNRLRERLDFETYNMGHLMTVASIHHRATGKTTLLEVARKAADYLCTIYKEAPKTLANNAICPSHYMGIVELYRTTGEQRYLDLATALIEIRDLVENGSDHNQDRVPFRQMTEAVGHAVRANYLYAGVADVFLETGDTTLLTTLETIWRDVVDRKLYVTGATGSLYDGASPDGSSKHGSIQLVHQAYGRDFQLPNITAYNESCATVGNVLWNWRMLLATGKAQYADVLELALYNGVLASISLDGTRFFYVNTLRKVRNLSFELRWSRQRQPYIGCFCCPPNVVRTIAEVSNYAYTLSKDAVWLHLYGASELATLASGERIRLKQETDYPWDGKVRITIAEAPKRPLAVKLRIPGWTDTAEIRLQGKAVEETPRPGSYFDIQRVWSAGDVVELNFPMPVKMLEAHPLVEEATNQVAIKRGPIVYCLESQDLPEGVLIEDVVIPLEAKLLPRRDTLAQSNLVTLVGEAAALKREPWTTHELYREVSRLRPRKIDLRLIPYYAWGNRGDGEMTVWLPVR